VLATSTVLALARIWNPNGARRSVGDATLMGALAIGAARATPPGFDPAAITAAGPPQVSAAASTPSR
jgi:hypothetical protein